MTHKISQQPRAIRRMVDLRVELRAVILARFISDDGKGCAIAGGDNVEPFGKASDFIAVTHPDLVPITHLPQTIKQCAFIAHRQESAAKFAAISGFMAGAHFAPQLMCHHLLAITYAKDR